MEQNIIISHKVEYNTASQDTVYYIYLFLYIFIFSYFPILYRHFKFLLVVKIFIIFNIILKMTRILFFRTFDSRMTQIFIQKILYMRYGTMLLCNGSTVSHINIFYSCIVVLPLGYYVVVGTFDFVQS